MTYKPETPWEISNNLIYNSIQKGWDKGVPNMVNDIGINIVDYNHSLSEEDVERIAKTVQKALNEEFSTELKEAADDLEEV